MLLQVLKNRLKTSCGFTLIELIIVLSIITIIVTGLLYYLNPAENRNKQRDLKRINDLSVMERMFTEYYVKNGVYPDGTSTLRNSITLSSGTSPSLMSSWYGWINEDLSEYNEKLPIDPVNEDILIYLYFSDGADFELNAVLEEETSVMTDDGGNDPARYEVGTRLDLLSP